MKITNIETYPVWGGFRNFLFVVVDTDEGIYGVGEAGITGRELAVAGAIEHFKPLLIGQDPFRIEHIWQLLFRGGFFPAQRVLGAAISAIDIALWDIKGKALGVPVYELLGGRVRDKVVCYPHNYGHGNETAALVESYLQTKKEGWKFVIVAPSWPRTACASCGVIKMDKRSIVLKVPKRVLKVQDSYKTR